MAWVLRIRASTQDVDLLSSVLWTFGPSGIAELPSDELTELIAGYSSEADAARALDALADLALETSGRDTGAFEATISIENPVDEWSGPPVNEVVFGRGGGSQHRVVIESGHAFGHGNHPTTALVLELAAAAIEPGDRVLDVGTGTGVLAIAAARLGAGSVVAVDNDPAALLVAAANVAANGPNRDVVRLSDALGDEELRFDVVLANLLLADLGPLAPTVQRRVAPGGTLIVSGCLVGQQDAVEALFGAASHRVERDGWLGLVFAAPNTHADPNVA